MAFKLFSWLLKQTDTSTATSTGTLVEDAIEKSGLELWLREMTFWACVRRIGTAVAACEYKTYRRGAEVEADEYWTWNFSPNANQTKTAFFTKMVSKLFIDGEAIIVEDHRGNRYIADSYSTHYDATNGDYYTDVEVWQGTKLPGIFKQSDVLALRLEGTQAGAVLGAISATAGELIDSAVNDYIRTHGHRGILNIDDVAAGDPDFNAKYKDLVTDKFKKFFTAEQAVLPLFSGYTYQDISGEGRDSSDLRNLMQDVQEITARTIGVPLSIAKGEGVTDADFADFVTTIVRPITAAFVQECNRKIYGKNLWRLGTKMTVDLGGIKYADMFGSAAQGADKLIGSGVCSINDVMARFGLPEIAEPWAEQHWMTKNYSPAEDLLDGLTGTETTEPQAPPGTNTQETDGSDDKGSEADT